MNLARLMASLKSHEGFRPTVYDDATGRNLRRGDTLRGVATIGYGTTVLSEPQAEWLLASRIAADHETLGRTLSFFDDLPDEAQEVLVEMAYQLGIPGLLKFHNTLAALGRHDWPAAAAGMRASRWAEQTPLRAEALTKRIETLTGAPAATEHETA